MTPPNPVGSDDRPRPQLKGYSAPHFSRGRPAAVEALWMLLQWLLVSSWLPGSSHRRVLLRLFGARVGCGVVIKPGVRVKFPWRLSIGCHSWIGEDVWIDNLADVSIGANCCLSQGAYICTGSHDWSRRSFDLVTKPVVVRDSAWIAARAVVGPGVTIGEGAVLGLASMATEDLTDWTVYLGVPSLPICQRQHRDTAETVTDRKPLSTERR
jgi:putative colanic acid biosynthesis acetyltransferase WcaF